MDQNPTNMFIYEGKVTKLWPEEKVTNGIMESCQEWKGKKTYSKMDFTIFPRTLEKTPVVEGQQYKFIGFVSKNDWKDDSGEWHNGAAQFIVNSIEPINLPILNNVGVYNKSNSSSSNSSHDDYQDDSEISQEELDSIPF